MGSLARWFGISVGGAVVFGSVFLGIALTENSQGEFFDMGTGQLDWGYATICFGANFVVGFAGMQGLIAIYSVYRRVRR